ncbi:MAG TPA: hypothetical protein VJ349_06705 [Stellaceae bacterium]|nr:hypothetical protein [Stellaceae bacterium]
MNKLVGLVISTIAFAAPIAADASPVTWSFYETGITSCNSPRDCMLPRQPFVLMTLTLPGPTSTGTAIWQGGPSLPVYTGDSFALPLPFLTLHPATLTPAFAGAASNIGGRDCLDNFVGSGALCDFNISWAESAGVLTAISINVDAIDDSIGGMAPERGSFGLTGGPLASDFILGGCSNTQCTVAGFWQSDLAASIPEPMSAVLLITGLLGTCLASRSRLSG